MKKQRVFVIGVVIIMAILLVINTIIRIRQSNNLPEEYAYEVPVKLIDDSGKIINRDGEEKYIDDNMVMYTSDKLRFSMQIPLHASFFEGRHIEKNFKADTYNIKLNESKIHIMVSDERDENAFKPKSLEELVEYEASKGIKYEGICDFNVIYDNGVYKGYSYRQDISSNYQLYDKVYISNNKIYAISSENIENNEVMYQCYNSFNVLSD